MKKKSIDHTQLLLLKLLSTEDMYGYQIILELARRSSNVFEMKEGTLYVCIASHRVNIEPDDTYIRLIYDRLGEHVALEIPLPGREAQP